MECLIVNIHGSFIDLKVGMSFDHDVSLRATFQAKNNIRSTPASSALTLIFHRSHSVHTANHY